MTISPVARRVLAVAALGLSLASLVGCDHATKYAAKTELEGQPPRYLLGSVLDLRYVENTDVAFGLLRFIGEDVRRPLLLTTGAIGLAVLSIVLVRARARPVRLAAFLLLAGAAGNHLDRVFRGYVVDFIHVPHWPVFNVADIYVSAGIALLLLAIWRPQPA